MADPRSRPGDACRKRAVFIWFLITNLLVCAQESGLRLRQSLSSDLCLIRITDIAWFGHPRAPAVSDCGERFGPTAVHEGWSAPPSAQRPAARSNDCLRVVCARRPQIGPRSRRIESRWPPNLVRLKNIHALINQPFLMESAAEPRTRRRLDESGKSWKFLSLKQGVLWRWAISVLGM